MKYKYKFMHPHERAKIYASRLKVNKYPSGAPLDDFIRGVYIGYLNCMEDTANLNNLQAKEKCTDKGYMQRKYSQEEFETIFLNSRNFSGEDIN